VTRRSEDLPDRWFLMSAFDLVIVDAGSAGLTRERQRLLADHVAGGGRLLLVRLRAAGPGPLRELAAGGGAAGRHGLGSWRTEDLPSPPAGGLEGPLAQWIDDPKAGIRASPPRQFAAPPQDAFLAQLLIPGLGTVPVAMFLVLILGFVALVGAQTWHYVRRRRRPLALLVAVPATGFTCTAALLLYGLLSEGLGIQGAVRSFTILDQVAHEATSVTVRTLYAGLSPAALLPAPGTSLHCPQMWERNAPHRLRIDLDPALRVGGELLPARAPTTVTTVTRGPARERLRFRRNGGGLEVLAGADFAPAAEDGAVLLRDLDGACFASTASGAMRRVGSGPPDPGSLLGRYFDRVPAGRNDLPAWGRGRGYGIDAPDRQDALREYLGGILESLAPGTYVAWMQDVPSLDGLGLTVAWRASGHLVVGRLGPEDFVE
jgi:hypothetical protein